MKVTAHLERYHSVISRSEARALGLSDRMISRRIANRSWVRMAPQVYRIAGASPTWLAKQRAAALSVDGLVSHRAAARIHGFHGFAARNAEVTIDYRRSVQQRPGVAIHRSKQMHLADAAVVRGVPVTGLLRTVLDIASVVREHRLEEVVDQVIRDRLATWPDLYEVLVRHAARGRDGCGPFRALLDVRYGDTEIPDSVFNRRVGRLLGDVLIGHDVRFEYDVHNERGDFLGRVDLAYPTERVAIECDSIKFHLNRESFVKDRRRQNRLTNEGWTILNFSWWDYVDTPTQLVATVREALAAKTSQK